MPLGQTLAGLLPIAGAGIGTMWGPAGTALGGALGSVGQNLANDYFRQQSPAEQARAQLLQQLQGPAPYQRVNFDPIAQEEMRRFQQQVVPGITNQLAGVGGLNSSALRQALGGAGQDLQTRLAALRAQHDVGENQFMAGAEERRRGMLGNLAGGMFGEEQAMQAGRQNQIGQMLGSVPGLMLQNAGLQNQRQFGMLGNLLSGLGEQRAFQEGAVQSGTQAAQPILGQSFENLMRQDPTRAQNFLNVLMQLVGTGAQVGGQLGAAAIRGGV